MSTARNSRFEVRGGSELEVCSIQSLEPALRGVDAKFLVDLKFEDCIRSWRLEVRGSFPLGFEVRSIQSLGAAEEGVDAKFEVKRAEIQHRRIPKCPRESPPVEIKGSDEYGDESFELESNLLEISPLQSSLSRIRRALDDTAIYRRRTPSLMRSILSIAAYSVLSKIDDADGGMREE